MDAPKRLSEFLQQAADQAGDPALPGEREFTMATSRTPKPPEVRRRMVESFAQVGGLKSSPGRVNRRPAVGCATCVGLTTENPRLQSRPKDRSVSLLPADRPDGSAGVAGLIHEANSMRWRLEEFSLNPNAEIVELRAPDE
jgi:hypothetical protein